MRFFLLFYVISALIQIVRQIRIVRTSPHLLYGNGFPNIDIHHLSTFVKHFRGNTQCPQLPTNHSQEIEEPRVLKIKIDRVNRHVPFPDQTNHAMGPCQIANPPSLIVKGNSARREKAHRMPLSQPFKRKANAIDILRIRPPLMGIWHNRDKGIAHGANPPQDSIDHHFKVRSTLREQIDQDNPIQRTDRMIRYRNESAFRQTLQ